MYGRWSGVKDLVFSVAVDGVTYRGSVNLLELSFIGFLREIWGGNFIYFLAKERYKSLFHLTFGWGWVEVCPVWVVGTLR